MTKFLWRDLEALPLQLLVVGAIAPITPTESAPMVSVPILPPVGGVSAVQILRLLTSVISDVN